MFKQEDLHAYQLKAIDFIKTKRRVGLALFMGAGKTTSTLTAIKELAAEGKVKKTLIMPPLRVANTVWAQEAMKWEHLKDLEISICTGNEDQRRAGFHRKASIYIINRENVKWLVENARKWKFDCVVIDESSSFKSPKSQRFKALKSVAHQINTIVLLSGTPAPNGLLDLWSQQYMIDYGMTLGRTYTAYKSRFFVSDYMGYKLSPKPGADETIHKLIDPSWVSMAAEDYLELPDRIDLTVSIKLSPKLKDDYEEFKDNMILELPDGDVEALSAASLAGRLLEFCNGAIYIDDTKNFKVLHDLKLDALENIIDENEGENILVAYNYRHDLIRLKERFPTAVVLDKDGKAVKDWNDGQIKLLLAHPQSAGHGLNLQIGGSIIVWFGLSWSLEYYQQFNTRLYRQGQTKPVRIIHLITEGCQDKHVMDVLTIKDVTQQKLLDAIKADIESARKALKKT